MSIVKAVSNLFSTTAKPKRQPRTELASSPLSNSTVSSSSDPSSLPPPFPTVFAQQQQPQTSTGKFKQSKLTSIEASDAAEVSASRLILSSSIVDISANSGPQFVCQIGSGVQGSGNDQFNQSSGMAFDRDGVTLYVADYLNDRVKAFNIENGECVRNFSHRVGNSQTGPFDRPGGLSLDNSRKQIWVTDGKNQRIQIFDRNTGSSLRQVGGAVKGGGEQYRYTAVFIDEADDVAFVSDR